MPNRSLGGSSYPGESQLGYRRLSPPPFCGSSCNSFFSKHRGCRISGECSGNGAVGENVNTGNYSDS